MSESTYPAERGTDLDVPEGQSGVYEAAETGRSSDTQECDRRERDEHEGLVRGDQKGDGADVGAAPGRTGALVSDPESLRRRWESVQVGFVDDPRQAVGDADGLVSVVIEDLADGFRRQRQRLESRWSDGGDASTDDLRESFQRYRDFFERLIQV